MKKLLALSSLFVLAACGPASVIPDPNWASVRDEVFIPSCGCHTGGSSSGNLTLDGDTSADLLDSDSSGHTGWKLLVAGEPEQSLVYVRLSGGGDDVSAMPPSSSGLPDADVVDAIAAWIEAGAAD